MKHLKLTLLLLTFTIILAACAAPEPTATPSAVPTLTATASATATSSPTPIPSPTATAEPPTPTPTQSAQEVAEERIHQASVKYLASNFEEAVAVAREINFTEGDTEHPNNMCGPLAAAIMRDGGYLPPESEPKEMWLLCARTREDNEACHGTRDLERKFFSKDDYDYVRVEDSVGKYDWKANPLQVGDWLYLYVLKGISNFEGFDHMLVVSRIDERGRAYSVTNNNHGEGFVIREELLYDPNRPGTGLFYELTNDDLRQELGMTGTWGFLIVRAKNLHLYK